MSRRRPPPNRHHRKLGDALARFLKEMAESWTSRLMLGLPMEEDGDETMAVERRQTTARFRRAVLEAASHGAENSLCWHSLATWTEIGKERIGFFSRALDCIRRDRAYEESATTDDWDRYYMEAESLYEIARVHAHEGAPDAARKFLEESLPPARLSDAAALSIIKPGHTQRNLIEGRIMAMLLQLPDESGEGDRIAE